MSSDDRYTTHGALRPLAEDLRARRRPDHRPRHGRGVRYRWEMVPAAGGEPDSIGTHVAMLGDDGRLISDHQFIDKPPSGR